MNAQEARDAVFKHNLENARKQIEYMARNELYYVDSVNLLRETIQILKDEGFTIKEKGRCGHGHIFICSVSWNLK